MSAGMAGIVATHQPRYLMPGDGMDSMQCECGKWRGDVVELHASHVAEELTKAGYGLVPDVTPEYGAQVMQLNGLSVEPHPQGPNPNPYWFSKSTHVRLVGPWKEIAALPDPLAAAMNDEKGRALVQAIHDRKAEA